MEVVESTLCKHFITFKVHSEPELKALLKNEHIFCIVVGCNIREKEDIIKVRKICSATPKVPCLMHGHANEQKFLFQLAKAGLEDFITIGNIEQLIEKLHFLNERTTFRIDLCEFGIDLDKCTNYWTKQFLNFILKDYNFLQYRTIGEIAKKLNTSTANLDMAVKKVLWISPKQIILCFRNYYAAYLLDKTKWSTKDIAESCGFNNELEFYKSFRHKTGTTIMSFCRENNWRDFPGLYLENIKQKPNKTNI